MKPENQRIEERIQNSGYYKYQGIAPEGFKLIPDQVLEDLKDFDNWKDFKSDGDKWIEERSKMVLMKKSAVISASDRMEDYGDVYDEHDY
jgi:hypothetical protein